MGSKTFFSIIASSGYSYSTEYQTVLDYATAQGYTLPEEWDKQQEDALVRLLVSSGIWAQSDQIFNLSATGDRNFALINIKNPGTKNATLSATAPTWEKGEGFFGNGSSAYIRTNFIPSTDGVNFIQDNAGVFVYIPEDYAGNNSHVDYGANNTSTVNATHASLRTVTNNCVFRVNSTNGITIAGNTSASGSYGFSRSGATTTKLFKNGVQLGATSAAASTGLTSNEIYLCAYNNGGTPAGYSIKKFGFYIIGANLDSVISSLHSYINSFFTTSQTISIPSFPNKTSISSYITSLSGLASALPYTTEPSQQLIDQPFTISNFFSGALASNGYIYCAPGSATSCLKIKTADQTVSSFSGFADGSFKYGGAIFTNGAVYFIPANATVVAKINIADDSITWLDSTGVKGTESGDLGATAQKWYGAYVGADGKIYSPPYNATSVLIIDPATDAITFMDTTGIIATPSGNLSGSQKWDTGCNYGNFVYGVPSDATDALKIDTVNHTCSRVGSFPSGTAKWALSSIAPNGSMYFFPYYRNEIIKYDTSDDTYDVVATIGTTDTKVKVLGSSIMPNGQILLGMSDASYTNHYMFNPANDTLLAFQRNTTASCNGGVLAGDGSVYLLPNLNPYVQRIYFPRRSMSLPDNFTNNNYVSGY